MSIPTRANVRQAVNVPGSLVPMDAGDAEAIRVQVTDLSPEGAALAVDAAIGVGTTWTLHIHSTTGGPDRSAPVVVRWNRTDDQGGGACGVEFCAESDDSATISQDGQAPAPNAVTPDEGTTIGQPGVVNAKHLDVLSLQNVRGKVDGNVTFESEMADCSLQVNGNIESDLGTIRGGVVRVGKNVQIGQLGDRNGSPTELVLGSIPSAESMLTMVPGYLKSIDTQMSSLKAELAALEANIDSLDHGQKERVTEITFEIQGLKTKRESIEAKKTRLEAALKSSGAPSLTVRESVHAGVTIRFRDHELVCEEFVPGPVSITFDESTGLAWSKPAAA